jgi:hypothetical protein
MQTAAMGELQTRHARALELMGSREEELADARADFQDAKALYRAQVTQLLDELEAARRQTGAK